MAKKILIGAAALVALLAVLTALQPAEFSISRSVQIEAPAAKIFPIVNDLHRWDDWSPWSKMDPAMAKEFSGAAKGVGAAYAWKGNDKVGEGKQAITESKPNELVRIQLDFERPMKASNQVEFLLKAEGQGTRVTWTMSGKNGFIGKFFTMTGMMDKMVGKDFEAGLAQLKALAEKK